MLVAAIGSVIITGATVARQAHQLVRFGARLLRYRLVIVIIRAASGERA